MNHYVLRKVNGDVRKHFTADIMSSDSSMGLFYVNGEEGPELTCALKLGVGDVIELEGPVTPAFDKVKIESTLGTEYVTVEELVTRFSNVRASLLQHQQHLDVMEQENKRLRRIITGHKEENEKLHESLRTHARVIQNLSQINKQLEDYNGSQLIQEPEMYQGIKVPTGQVTSGFAGTQAPAQQETENSRSRFDKECEGFFRDHD